MADEKTYTTTCEAKRKIYRTTGATKQDARDKAMVQANADGYLDSNCKTSD